MSTAGTRHRPPSPALPLRHGMRMKQEEFHRLYEMCPDHVKFELVGGLVYVASPARMPHGTYDSDVDYLLKTYAIETPGVEVAHNVTAILGEESEPQPDLTLCILREYGGQSRINEQKYLEGPPELLTEISHSTRAFDLKQKKADYEATGVAEYLVVCVEEHWEIHWFDFRSGKKIVPNRQGIYRSRVFPGLWIDGQALLDRKMDRCRQVLRQGLASREHAAFVKRLKAAKK